MAYRLPSFGVESPIEASPPTPPSTPNDVVEALLAVLGLAPGPTGAVAGIAEPIAPAAMERRMPTAEESGSAALSGLLGFLGAGLLKRVPRAAVRPGDVMLSKLFQAAKSNLPSDEWASQSIIRELGPYSRRSGSYSPSSIRTTNITPGSEFGSPQEMDLGGSTWINRFFRGSQSYLPTADPSDSVSYYGELMMLLDQLRREMR